MNVESSDLALIFGRSMESGKLCRVLWPYDVDEVLGCRWVVRLVDLFECIVPDMHLMYIDTDQLKDAGARELLSEKDRVLWDAWVRLPEIDF